MTFHPIHQHLLIKAIVSQPITKVATGKRMLKEMVETIGMTPVTKPQVVYVNEVGNEGLTGSINLATSHIAFHVWDTTNLLMLDVYSCKHFEVSKVFYVLAKYFGPSNIHYKVIDREIMEEIDGRY